MQAQLARLAELSRKKALNAHREAENIALVARNEKMEAWNKVKEELPEEAEFLAELGKAFEKQCIKNYICCDCLSPGYDTDIIRECATHGTRFCRGCECPECARTQESIENENDDDV